MNRQNKDSAFFYFLIVVFILILVIGIFGTKKEKQTAKDVEENVGENIIAEEIIEGAEEAVEVLKIERQNDFYLSECKLSPELQKAVWWACNDTGIPISVALGLIEVESGFNSAAVNAKTGCYGLCQLHPLYFESDLSPEENIATGIKHLARLYGNNGGDMEKALTIYNVGQDNGSRSYAKKVMQAAAKWEEIFCNVF